ncbi:MAG TPA: hypothetical protein VNZ53_58180 [Steroidobacteraceae bacterium]|nr:hypothetical protein [Steroidobacteraceae bacterium]
MNHIERVVVDECVGQESSLVGQLRQRLDERPVKFVFLATEYPGIPDIEILDKLLDARSALLTQDRVLHNLAISRGFRSFIHTPESDLTDRRLAHVSAPDKHLPVTSGALRSSYQPQSNREAQAIMECLYGFLSPHQLKQFRTKRRRIRAHFGSPGNIVAAALTIGQRRTEQGMVGGYMLKVDARHGVKSLFPASESYFLDRAGNEPLQATSWALVHLFQLQLQSYPLTLYHLDGAALARCTDLIDDRGAAATPVERMVARLLASVSRPNAAECTKGRFFDRASDKLSQLTRFATNELVSFDLQAIASALADEGALRSTMLRR